MNEPTSRAISANTGSLKRLTWTRLIQRMSYQCAKFSRTMCELAHICISTVTSQRKLTAELRLELFRRTVLLSGLRGELLLLGRKRRRVLRLLLLLLLLLLTLAM